MPSTRRSTLVAIACLTASVACAQLFPSKGSPQTIVVRPRTEKEMTRRRAGSDVTLPARDGKSWIVSTLVPCDRDENMSEPQSIAAACEQIDPKGDIMRPAHGLDSAMTRRP